MTASKARVSGTSLDFNTSDYVAQSRFSNTLTSHSEVPDLGPLKMSVLSKLAGVDRFLCQYEVPGGGVCRDITCTDLHLGDVQPSGVSYLISLSLTIF